MFGAPLGGGFGSLFSDLVRVPFADAMLVRLPDGLDSVAMASAGDNWSLAWRLVAPHLEARPAGAVWIMSRGSIGLYACDIARALGASRCLYVDPDARRRGIAEGFGAETAAAIEPLRQTFDIAIEVAGRVRDLATACLSLVPEGCPKAPAIIFGAANSRWFEMYLSGVNLRIGRDSVRAHSRRRCGWPQPAPSIPAPWSLTCSIGKACRRSCRSCAASRCSCAAPRRPRPEGRRGRDAVPVPRDWHGDRAARPVPPLPERGWVG